MYWNSNHWGYHNEHAPKIGFSCPAVSEAIQMIPLQNWLVGRHLILRDLFHLPILLSAACDITRRTEHHTRQKLTSTENVTFQASDVTDWLGCRAGFEQCSMAGLAASSSGYCLLGQRSNQTLSVSLVVVWSKSCSAQLCLHSSGTLRESPSCFPQLICKAVAAVKYQPLAQSPDCVVRSVSIAALVPQGHLLPAAFLYSQPSPFLKKLDTFVIKLYKVAAKIPWNQT